MVHNFVKSILLLVNVMIFAAQDFECQSQKSYEFSMLFIRESFPSVNLSDADASLRVWSEMYSAKLLVNSKVDIRATYKILDKYEDLIPYLKSNNADMVSIPSIGYTELFLEKKYTPFLSSDFSGNKFEQYVLIVRKDSGINSLADLKGKSIILQDNVYNLSGKWLEVELWKGGLEKKETHFSWIENEIKELKIINEVFFKKFDSAIVTLSKLELANELNPQILNSLNIINQSDLLITHISVLNNDINPEIKKTLIRAVDDINTDEASKQVLNIFKTQKILIIKEEDLKSVDILMKEFNSIK